MVDQSAIYLLGNIAAAAALLWFFTGPWQALCADISKMKCFELQTQLVEAAAAGRVRFSDPVYKMLWQHLEFRTQSNYSISLDDLAAALNIFRQGTRCAMPLDEAISEVEDGRLRMELMHIYNRSIEIQILQAIARSPALLLLAVLAPAVVLVAFWGIGVRESRRFIVNLAQIAVNERAMVQRASASLAVSC